MKTINNILAMGLIALSIISFWSCSTEDAQEFLANTELSDEEIAEGLRKALTVGTDTATSLLAITDGYYKDEIVKILLPEEMNSAISSFKAMDVLGVTGNDIYSNGFSSLGIPSLKSKEDELILGINRAAESAAKEAGAIFVDGITNMTITDAKEILEGQDTAATHFLRVTTYNGLFDAFQPKIQNALDQVTISDKSVATLYTDYVTTYNDIIQTSTDPTGFISQETVAEIGNLTPIETTDLAHFATGKGLNGLFIKVADEEKNIREDPFAYVSDVLEKVFGSIL